MDFTKNSESFQDLSSVLKAVADPLRLRILRILRQDSFGVLELSEIFAMPQPGMSHHLKILTTSQFVEARREGNFMFYRRAVLKKEDPFYRLRLELFRSIDHEAYPHSLAQQVEKVQAQRAKASLEFFEKHAHEFTEKKHLIASFDQYGEPLLEGLLPLLRDKGKALEVGPGEGELLVALTREFDQVFALDNSQEMRKLSRQRLEGQGIHSVEMLLGSFEEAMDDFQDLGLVVLSMVLHHMASPAQAFKKLAKALSPRGIVAVVELCPHDQDWVREVGDIWLGFSPEDLKNWARDQGLLLLESLFLGLKNGFQVQIQIFGNDAQGDMT